MITKIRETKNYTVYKSLAGMGVSVSRHQDGENSLWNTELDQKDVEKIVSCSEKELNIFVRKNLIF